ncbi:hypothetical protein [Desulfosediminicola sp.]|uniref:hypothetical protein n=1 Tax=Desulfosediminicola sp. TaxID=2886825 RepID=UPI003AF30B7C
MQENGRWKQTSAFNSDEELSDYTSIRGLTRIDHDHITATNRDLCKLSGKNGQFRMDLEWICIIA